MPRTHALLSCFAALVLVACGGPAPSQEEGAPPPAPPAAAPTSAASESLPAKRESQPATRPAVPTPPAKPVVAGRSRVALDLTAPFDMAGFELHLSFDRSQFTAGPADKTEALDGFLCQDNPELPGGYKIICARIPSAETSGRLAVVPFTWAERPLTREDLRVDAAMVVDADSKPAPEGVRVELVVLD